MFRALFFSILGGVLLVVLFGIFITPTRIVEVENLKDVVQTRAENTNLKQTIGDLNGTMTEKEARIQHLGAAKGVNTGESAQSEPVPPAKEETQEPTDSALQKQQEWEEEKTTEAPDVTTVPPTGPSCPNFGYRKGRWIPNNRTTELGYASYAWQIDDPSCKLEQWDSGAFCKLLNGRNILLVGDSINGQFFRSLIGKLSFKPTSTIKSKHTRKKLTVEQDGTICNFPEVIQSKIANIRNDHLHINTVIDPDNEFHHPWVPVLEDYEVVILNTGAHAVNGNENRKILENVKQALENYKGTVILRTTPRGHRGCKKGGDTPMLDEDDPRWKTYFEQNKDGTYKKYQYGAIPKNNEVYFELWEHKNIIDVARLTELRPDGHLKPPGDCLHYDNTELYDTWNTLVYNALQNNL